MAEITVKKRERVEMGKSIPIPEAFKIVNEIEFRLKIGIIDLIKKLILSGNADSFQISKDRPYIRLYIGNYLDDISISFSTLKEEMDLKIPKEAFSKL